MRFREACHFHWVQVPTLLSLAHALSPGGKAQIPYKVVPARNCPILLIRLTCLPDPDLSLVQSRERLSPGNSNPLRGSKLTCLKADGRPRPSHPGKLRAGQCGSRMLRGELGRPRLPQAMPQSTGSLYGQFQAGTSASVSPTALATSTLLRPQGLAGGYAQCHSVSV